MQAIILYVLLSASLLLSSSAMAQQPPRTALDLAQILIQHSGPVDDQLVMELLTGGIEANMRVPPEHLGVAFWNRQTGERLDRQEIRELIGPVRQDGALQLITMAVELSGGRLALDAEQLELLMDAAFVASLRRPPAHLDVEYYDRRQGPTGQGGGVSGRVPETSSSDSAQSSAPATPSQSPRPQRPESLPPTKQAMLEKLASLDFTLEPTSGHFLFPLVVWAQGADQLEATLKDEINALENLGSQFVGLTDDPRLKREDNWLLLYAVGEFAYLPTMNEQDREDTQALQELLLEMQR